MLTMNNRMIVKEWVIDKAQQIATKYNSFIDFERDENGMRKVENGCITVFVDEIITETEKAIQVVLHTGNVVGTGKGWKMFIPKSQIVEQ